MRLTPKAVRAVERGTKTTHRVLVKDPTTKVRKNGTRYFTQPFRPSVGHTISIQPASDNRPEVRVLITGVARGLLGDITPAEVQAEGYQTLAEFADHWMRTHTTAWPPKTEALCKNCDGHETYIDHEGQNRDCQECELGIVLVDDTPDAETILDRFERHHAHHLVWVVTFEYQADTTRWLNKRAHLPTTTSMSEALEPDAPILGPPSKEWKERSRRLHEATLKDRDGARLAGLDRIAADLEAEAMRLGLESDADVASLVRQVGQKVDHIKRKVEGRSDQHRRAA